MGLEQFRNMNLTGALIVEDVGSNLRGRLRGRITDARYFLGGIVGGVVQIDWHRDGDLLQRYVMLFMRSCWRCHITKNWIFLERRIIRGRIAREPFDQAWKPNGIARRYRIKLRVTQ